ncbi:MAG: SufD family Fe-S cluster assembly protein [Thaumarchaeota archaeon]|nr:SufD family Fe-S cluster assembly protein [Nitrososphaerota archaeon]
MAQKATGVFTEEDVIRLSERFREPDWLRNFRLDAFRRYLELPLELSPLYTKYTNVSNFDPNQFSVRTEEEEIDLRSYFEGYLSGKETNILLQANATTVHVDLDESLARKGLELMSIHEAVSKRESLMRELFGTKLVNSEGEKYAAFNNAFFNSGTFINIPRGLVLEAPIRKMLLVHEPKGSIIEQTIIHAEEGSKLNFFEELYTKESSKISLVSSAFEVRTMPGANVGVSSLQLLDEKTVYLSNKNVSALNDSRITSTAILLGSWITRSRMNLLMNGRGSAVEGFEVFFCGGKQRFDLESNLVHNSPDSTAATHARGVLKDESQSIFKGMIKIKSNAKNSSSYLAHHAMILDKRARSDGIPGLSIDTNEVKATHSASVAQIDEEQIFYLMTRGLSPDEAKKMIILGFFEPVLARIPVEIAREGAKFILEGKWHGEKRRLLDRETLIALTGEAQVEVKQADDIFERHYKYRK